MKPELDFLINTSKQPNRIWNCTTQVLTALNSGLNVRVTLAMNGPWPELEKILEPYSDKIRWVHDAPDGPMGNASLLYCLQNLEWAEWLYNTGDDDCLLPWGLQHLWDHREGVSMVIGQAACVRKGSHEDLTHYKVGRSISPGRVSGVCTLFNMNDMLKLSRPLFDGKSQLADYELIERMSVAYKYKFITNFVTVLALV